MICTDLGQTSSGYFSKRTYQALNWGVMARRHPRGFHLGSSTGDTIHTVLAPCLDSRRDGVDTEHYSMMKAGGLP
jgi:hypothetical protein